MCSHARMQIYGHSKCSSSLKFLIKWFKTILELTVTFFFKGSGFSYHFISREIDCSHYVKILNRPRLDIVDLIWRYEPFIRIQYLLSYLPMPTQCFPAQSTVIIQLVQQRALHLCCCCYDIIKVFNKVIKCFRVREIVYLKKFFVTNSWKQEELTSWSVNVKVQRLWNVMATSPVLCNKKIQIK